MPGIVRLIGFCVFIFLSVSACQTETSRQNPQHKIISTNAQKQFVKTDGTVFEPWGYNYNNPQIINLIEDNWDHEWAWSVIESDFQEMKIYGANTVRIHLQYNKLMTGPETVNPDALDKLARLVGLAEQEGLYLLVTGLGAYRKSDTPAWYDALSNDERWDTQARFWTAVAGTIGESPAVFSYDLINEPLVSIGKDWLYGEHFGGYHFVQNITLGSNTGFEETMARWIDKMTAAIRDVDETTLITVGFFPSQDIGKLAPHLDYISTHIYPKRGSIDDSKAFIAANQSDKPFVLTETGQMASSIGELRQFLQDTDPQVDGVLAHYHGKTLEEMARSPEITDALYKQLVELMITLNPNTANAK